MDKRSKSITRYDLAFDYMLYLQKLIIERDGMSIASMGDKTFFMDVAQQLGLQTLGFSWDKFNISIEHLDENHPAFFYEFPEPGKEPEAFYGALVINKEKNSLSYYTLEKTKKVGWLALGYNSPKERKSFGLFEASPSKEKFFELIMGAGWLFLSGDTTTVFEMPTDYQLLNSLPEDPDNCLNYYKDTDTFNAFIQLYAIDRQSAMEWNEDRKIIDRIHKSMSDIQALIEVKSGKTARGYHYVYSIVKNQMEPSGVQYFLLFQVLYGEAALNVKAFFSEKGMTGLRDTTIFELAYQTGMVSIDDRSKWTYDPYDGKIQHPYLMNYSEEREFDPLFPGHPLSQCRDFINYLIENQ